MTEIYNPDNIKLYFRKDGVFFKTNDNKLESYSFYVYVREYGQIEKKQNIVIHLDGNRKNFNPENLFCVPRSCWVVFRELRSYPMSREQAETLCMIAHLHKAQRKAECDVYGSARSAWEAATLKVPEKAVRFKQKQREHDKKWRQANPEKVREMTKKWRQANPEKVREMRMRNRPKEYETHKIYCKTHRAEINAAARAWREKNREKFLAMRAAWREKNREKLRECSRASYQRRKETISMREKQKRLMKKQLETKG